MAAVNNYINTFGEYYPNVYTPQQATKDGYNAGIKTAIDLIKEIDKPTKQVKALLAELEKKQNG